MMELKEIAFLEIDQSDAAIQTQDSWIAGSVKFFQYDTKIYVIPPNEDDQRICSRCLILRLLSSKLSLAPHSQSLTEIYSIAQELWCKVFQHVRLDGSFYHVYSFDLQKSDIGTYPIFSLPDCSVCKVPNKHDSLEPRRATLLTGRCGGVIRQIEVKQIRILDTLFPVWVSTVEQVSPFSSEPMFASGKGWCREDAIFRGIGEAVEHYTFDYHRFVKRLKDIENNSGWAAHESSELASSNSVRELIERDAFLRCWYWDGFGIPDENHLEMAKKSADVEYLLDRIGMRLMIRACPTTVPGYFCHAALIWHEQNAASLPCSVFGLGCDLDPGVSVDLAVLEAVQMLPAAHYHSKESPIVAAEDCFQPRDHAAYYAKKFRSDELKPFFEATFRDGNRCMIQRNEITTEEITPKDLASIGLAVCRSSCQGLVKMHFGSNPKALHKALHPLG